MAGLYIHSSGLVSRVPEPQRLHVAPPRPGMVPTSASLETADRSHAYGSETAPLVLAATNVLGDDGIEAVEGVSSASQT